MADTEPRRNYKVMAQDRKTHHEYGLRIAALDVREASERVKWLGFDVVEIDEADPLRADPKLTGEPFSADYTGQICKLGEVYAASEAAAKREPGALARLAEATDLEWTRGWDRHALLEALAIEFGRAKNRRLVLACWQWMAELPEFKEHLRRDSKRPVSADNVVELKIPVILADLLRDEGFAERAAEIPVLVGEALKGHAAPL